MSDLLKLAEDPRVTVRRTGAPDAEGTCVVYWMQRAQRGVDNPALDVAVAAANELGKPVGRIRARSFLSARESSPLSLSGGGHS